MTWANDPPKEPGLYQYRPPDADIVVFLEIERENGELVAVTNNSLERTKLYSLPGQWRGPITDMEQWR